MEIELKPLVLIVMGSSSDAKNFKLAEITLTSLQIAHSCHVLSAHRTPKELIELATDARHTGVRVIIAGAGGAAHLAGAIAAHSQGVPVIGVPIQSSGTLGGLDALLATVQMPPGVPVATVGINGAENAALLAAQILSVCPDCPEIFGRLTLRRFAMAEKVRADNLEMSHAGIEGFLRNHPPSS
ncbi:MAG: 5-(carboxyamino)imidazole ribonucleotide mutase [Candidatus Taylorbacteria bacterium]